MHLQSFLTSLPMTLTPSFATDIKIARRFSTKTLTNVCHMVPILGELRGTGARDGAPFAFKRSSWAGHPH